MKALVLSVAAAAFLCACSPGETPTPTATPTLDPSIPLLDDDEAAALVFAHLQDTWHDESASSCWDFLLDTTNYRVFGGEHLGDRTWQVTGESEKERFDLVWKVYQTGEASGNVESPEWLKEHGCE